MDYPDMSGGACGVCGSDMRDSYTDTDTGELIEYTTHLPTSTCVEDSDRPCAPNCLECDTIVKYFCLFRSGFEPGSSPGFELHLWPCLHVVNEQSNSRPSIEITQGNSHFWLRLDAELPEGTSFQMSWPDESGCVNGRGDDNAD